MLINCKKEKSQQNLQRCETRLEEIPTAHASQGETAEDPKQGLISLPKRVEQLWKFDHEKKQSIGQIFRLECRLSTWWTKTVFASVDKKPWLWSSWSCHPSLVCFYDSIAFHLCISRRSNNKATGRRRKFKEVQLFPRNNFGNFL